MQPEISVLLPLYNIAADQGTAFLNALHSLRLQEGNLSDELPSFEILLLNDGSTDDTAQLLNAIAQNWSVSDPALQIFHFPHRGIAATLNAGLNHARGRFIARMDADDSCDPHRLSSQYIHLQTSPHIQVSATQVVFGGDKARAAGFAHYVDWQNSLCTPWQIAISRFRDTPVCHPTVMFHKHLVQQYGNYSEGNSAEDWELWLRWMDAGVRFEKIALPLYTWNDPPQRLTRTDSRYSLTANNQLRASWLARYIRQSAPEEIYVWGAGRRARARLAPLWEQGILPTAFIDIDPKKIGQRILLEPHGRFLPVIAPETLLERRSSSSLVLNALTAHDAYEKVADWFSTHAFQHGTDWLLT